MTRRKQRAPYHGVICTEKPTTWVDVLDKDELLVEATPLMILDLDEKYTLDDVANLMLDDSPRFFATLKDHEKHKLIANSVFQRQEEKRPPRRYWDALKQEFHIFLCTDDPRYQQPHEKLSSASESTSTTIVGIVAAFIGSNLGVEVGAITGLVAVLLYGVLKVGKEAYCRNAYNK